MTARDDHCETTRERLLPYLAETLPDAEREAVATHLEACATCHDAYETLRAEYETLGMLPDVEPPRGLAARTASDAIHVTKQRERPERRFRWGEWLAAAAVLIVLGIIILPMFAPAREAARRASTQNNMKQLGLVFKMYANEDPGERFPPLAPIDGAWVPDLRVLFPEYLTDPSVLITVTDEHSAEDLEKLNEALQAQPTDWETAHRIVARHFVYTGYALATPEDIRRFSEAQSNRPKRALDEDLPTKDGEIYRLREGIERFFIININNAAQATREQSKIPILIENMFTGGPKHALSGVNILYLDGHVDFMRDAKDNALFNAYRTLTGADETPSM